MDTKHTDTIEVLREAELCTRLKLNRVTIWRMVRRGAFPPPIKLTERLNGWRVSDVQQWLDGRHDSVPSVAAPGSDER